mgnify:CR=1 FL=1
MPEIKMTVEEIINVFLPGIVCVAVYDELANKNYKLQTYTVAGIIVGMVIKSLIDGVNNLILNTGFYTGFPIFVVYVIAALVAGVSYFKAKNCITTRKFMSNHFRVDTGDNFWLKNFDLDNGTCVILYLGNKDVVQGVVQSVDDDYITLVSHCSADNAYGDTMKDSIKSTNEKTVLCVPMKNVVKFEIYYLSDNDFSKFAFK